MPLDIAYLVKEKILRNWLKTAGEMALKKLGRKEAVSLVVAGEKKVKKLNAKYRGKNRVTDVLAFGGFDVEDFLGEIVVCLPQARRQAKEAGVSLKEEMGRLLLHGLLHLAGYDHEKSKLEAKKMLALQERFLKEILDPQGKRKITV
ncbi:MAG: rRNA maturation RNase YbeY [Candidatus Magasanikbacteria bacterium]|nr:rRNA maturation RNase YbeY [Candidatus Magasanikbacteria bacterium]